MYMSLNILFRYVPSPNQSSFFQLDKLICLMKYLGMWTFSCNIFLCFIHVTFSLPYMIFHNINVPQSIYLFVLLTNICMAYFFAFINITIQVARYTLQECLWDMQSGKLVGHKASKFSNLSKIPKCLQLDHLSNSPVAYEHISSNTR